MKAAIITLALGAGVSGFLYWQLTRAWDANAELKLEADRLDGQVVQLEAQRAAVAAELEAAEARMAELGATLTASREKAARFSRMVTDGRLARLARANPSVIQRRIRAATDRRWEELEALSRE